MSELFTLASYFAALAVSIIALIYGTGRLFKKNALAYFQFLIWGAVCFVLVSLSVFVNYISNTIYTHHITLSSCGIIGVLIAFLTANMGVLDRIVDEKNRSTIWARRLAIITPLIFAFVLGFIFIKYIKAGSIDFAIFILALAAPMVLGAYYNTKHLLLPIDEMEILKSTRGCNIMCLVFDIVEILYVYSVAIEQQDLMSLFYFVRAISVFVLIIFAVRGSAKWSL